MPTSHAPHAVVVGIDVYTGLQTARILASRGVPVIGVAGDPRHPFCRARACERIVAAGTSSEDLVPALQALGPELEHKAILFPCTDMSVLVISRHRHRLADHYHVVLNVGEKKTISQILHAVNSYTVTLISQQLGHQTKVKVWEGRPWDEVIRDENMSWQKIAYTLFNAWREGLVNDPLEPYLFSDLAE